MWDSETLRAKPVDGYDNGGMCVSYHDYNTDDGRASWLWTVECRRVAVNIVTLR